MQASEAAREFRIWAIQHGMLPRARMRERDQSVLLDRQLSPQRLTAASEILQKRVITFIGFNDKRNEVIVYTNTAIQRKEESIVPNEIEDVPIVYLKAAAVVVSGRPPPPMGLPYAQHNNRYTCGSSIFVGNMIGAGTLGCLVRNRRGIMYGLTNNHVTAACNYAPLKLPIVAPGPLDVMADSLDPFTIGHHADCFAFVDGLDENVPVQQNIDAALFLIKNPDQVSSMQRTVYDTPMQTMPIQHGMVVQKIGRTTGITQGLVRAGSQDPNPVDYNIPEIDIKKTVYFEDLFAIEGNPGPFADLGDSGSLVTFFENNQRFAVGMILSVSKDGTLTYAMPIDKVLRHFDVTLISGHHT